MAAIPSNPVSLGNDDLGSSAPKAAAQPATVKSPQTPAATQQLSQAAPVQTSQTPSKVSSDSLDPTLTFRRDARGQIYYVVSDPQSGRELAELPPKEIRNAREGVADYLKQQSQNRVGQSIKTEA